jgi:uncharacterized protein (TIGR00162 family)
MDITIQKKYKEKPRLKNPILVEGLPGIGNVGKIAADFLVDALKPKLLCKIFSTDFSHVVYLSKDSTVELPSVQIYLHRARDRDILILSGDEQPMSRKASYKFAGSILDLMEEFGCREIITLGGIGLPNEVQSPQIFGAVTDRSVLDAYKKYQEIKFDTRKRVELIFGASGLLLGLANLRGIKGIALLTETYMHPAHLGLREAKALLGQLRKILSLELDLRKLDEEISEASKAKIGLQGRKTDFLAQKLKPSGQLDEQEVRYIS